MSGSNPKAAAAGSAAGPGGLVGAKEEKKKAGGGVLNRLKARRQAPHHAAEDCIGAAVTEQELLALDTIRPEHVLRLSRVTESECPPCRAQPSRRALGPLSPSAEPAARRLTGPGVHPGPPSPRVGQAAPPAAPPGGLCASHPHLAYVGKGLSLSLTAFPRPATLGFSRAGRSPQLGVFG